ncbi:MAG: deoxyribose-phosphate aldolase [Acidobacteriaceae bacterium]|nr:deoxyribose-phosphate aldolase [Acidobacteriaceae bacterium]
MIERHCETAAACGFNAVMLQPCWIGMAREILRGTAVRVASAIAYPLGGETTEMKVALARSVVALGADEFDFQPNIGFLRSGMLQEFSEEMRLIVEAADGRPVKSMSEFGFLTREERILCITLAEEAGVAYVKNSSGVGPGGSPATPEDIRFIRSHLKGRTGIKASGGIRSYEQAEALVQAGADLIGSSAAPDIVSHATAASIAY